MRVYAFVGPSGTGKSYRAQMVAGENNIEYIIHLITHFLYLYFHIFF